MRVASFLGPLLFVSAGLAQAVEEGIAPTPGPPKGCETTVKGSFKIGTLDNPSLRKRETAQEAADGDLLCSLEDGILHDQYKRTGSIVANRQFQFDGPPQAGAIYTGGFSVCKNGSLAIGGSTRWWRCMSGAFGNLYDEYIGAQCHEIRIQTISEQSSSSSAPASGSTMASSTVSVASSAAASAASMASKSGSSALSSGSATASTAPASSLSGSTTRSGSSPSGTQVAVAPPAQGAASSFHLSGASIAAVLPVLGIYLAL